MSIKVLVHKITAPWRSIFLVIWLVGLDLFSFETIAAWWVWLPCWCFSFFSSSLEKILIFSTLRKHFVVSCLIEFLESFLTLKMKSSALKVFPFHCRETFRLIMFGLCFWKELWREWVSQLIMSFTFIGFVEKRKKIRLETRLVEILHFCNRFKTNIRVNIRKMFRNIVCCTDTLASDSRSPFCIPFHSKYR